MASFLITAASRHIPKLVRPLASSSAHISPKPLSESQKVTLIRLEESILRSVDAFMREKGTYVEGSLAKKFTDLDTYRESIGIGKLKDDTKALEALNRRMKHIANDAFSTGLGYG